MFRKICKATVWAGAALFAATLGAQQLPKSGSFDTQTGWKTTGDAFEVADKRMLGGGSVIGMIFNYGVYYPLRNRSFLPVLIDRQLRPEVLKHGDARFEDAMRFMHWVSEDFGHNFVAEGDEVVITGK